MTYQTKTYPALKHHLFSSLFEHTSNAIITDASSTIIDMNPSFCRITGYSHTEAVGKKPTFLQSGQQDKPFYQDMWQQLKDKRQWQGEVWNRRKDGFIYPELLTIYSVTNQ
jgi:PAS domain S-box-containing protein